MEDSDLSVKSEAGETPCLPANPPPPRRNSARNLVRWIMVVTLGCSLGLLMVFGIVSVLPVPRGDENLPWPRRGHISRAAFSISEERIEHDLQRVIQSQLSAFREDDYPTAYRYAAAELREQIPLPAFEHLVKTVYPLIARSRSVEFGITLDNGAQAVVNATIASNSGRVRHYLYFLQREGPGWKVSGVTEIKTPSMTV